MVWYSPIMKCFPEFIVIHTVKCFGIVNKADVFLELSCFFHDPGIKTIPMEKKCKKAKWPSGEALQITVKRREAKTKEKKKDISI